MNTGTQRHDDESHRLTLEHNDMMMRNTDEHWNTKA